MNRPAAALAAVLVLCLALVALAHEDEELPAGPIRDRHELMHGIGDNAKKIGDALKAGDTQAIPPAADAIAASARKIPSLFPAGSTNPKSRALPAIWQDFPRFQQASAELSNSAMALAQTAKEGGDAGAAAKTMFGACKACHDSFRAPDKD